MPDFNITVEEIREKCTLPWVVVLDNGIKVIECHVRTKEKAMGLAEKYQTRTWVRTAPAHRFLKDGFNLTEGHYRSNIDNVEVLKMKH
tara:strand:+ start:352 stop:615 length:264 start_codon:yes stop_codon:yes gene_type:complete